MSQKTKSSVGAFFNADSGVEWAINKIATESGPDISDVFKTSFSGGKVTCPTDLGCELYLLDDKGKVITADTNINNVKAVRAIGSKTAGESTQRAIEAAVAAEGGGIYTNWGFSSCVGNDSEIYHGEAIYPGWATSTTPVVGGVICLNGNLTQRFPKNIGTGNWLWMNGHQTTDDGVVVSCAVCVHQ